MEGGVCDRADMEYAARVLSECEPPREEDGGKDPLAEEGATVECCEGDVSGLADGGCPGITGPLLEDLGGDGNRPLRF